MPQHRRANTPGDHPCRPPCPPRRLPTRPLRPPVTGHDNRHAVHVRIGRHFELRLYLSPTVLAALLGGGTTTALAIVLAR
ncbi:hypothetical protein [Streptomyces prasinus]|uniref:hypothetical protein n=1 Tax=Streptomyces prasinus TaxID=67345 RepID=UPI000A66DDA8|nr:hypothetical protein [Streptomyces prasinus]